MLNTTNDQQCVGVPCQIGAVCIDLMVLDQQIFFPDSMFPAIEFLSH